MKSILAALIVMTSTPTWAQTYQCFFTEPFILVGANAEEGAVAISVFGNDSVETVKASSLGNLEQLVFTFESAGFSSLKIDFLTLGNDGMSDKVYQYEGVLANTDGSVKLYGGCNKQP